MSKRTARVPLRRALFRLATIAGIAAMLGAFPALSLAAQGGGGGETTIGNNLSFPAIWSEGVTLPLRGTFGSPQLQVPFNTTDADGNPLTLYLQGVEQNTWQAENVTPTAPVNISQIDWGDNLESRSLSPGKPIRVEANLYENLPSTELGLTSMLGFNMVSASGTKNTEVFGTDGTTYQSSQASIYSGCARLTIQRLDISRDDPYASNGAITWDPVTGQWTGAGLIADPMFNGGVWAGGEGSGFAGEINGSGKADYGYNWNPSTAGDYRITFSLDPNCPVATLNTFFTDASTVYVTPTETGAVTPLAEGTGSTAQIDAADNLSYIDVEVGNPVYPPYVPPKPENTTLPLISGTAQQGQVLSVDNGTWKNTPETYTYQWKSCDTAGSACTDIAGATSSTYTLTAAEVGHTLRAAVTATNANGTAEAVSAATSEVLPLAPAIIGPPTILGVPQEGHTLYATNGTWDNATSFAYQWQVSDGGGWVDVAGANAGSYLLTEAVVGHTMRLVVTAYNLGGSTSATSAATAVIAAHQEQTAQRTKARLTLQLRWMTRTQLHLWGFVYPPHNGRQLMVQERTRAGWKTVATVRLQKATTQRSRYAITLANATPGFYRVYLAGDTAHFASTSSQVRARGLARVTLQLRQLTRDRLRLYGSLFPARNGQNVMLQLRTRSGWRTLTRARLRFATRTHSHYSVILTHPKHGIYRASYGGDSAYRPGNSASVTVR